jgi:hypothetical protein
MTERQQTDYEQLESALGGNSDDSSRSGVCGGKASGVFSLARRTVNFYLFTVADINIAPLFSSMKFHAAAGFIFG